MARHYHLSFLSSQTKQILANIYMSTFHSFTETQQLPDFLASGHVGWEFRELSSQRI